MHDCVVKLLKSNNETSFECLCVLLVAIGKDLDHEKAKVRVEDNHVIHFMISLRPDKIIKINGGWSLNRGLTVIKNNDILYTLSKCALH